MDSRKKAQHTATQRRLTAKDGRVMTDSDASTDVEFKRAQLAFERERWQAEEGWRRDELELKRSELNRPQWFNPLVIAILAVAVAAVGNIVVTFVCSHEQSRLISDQAAEIRRLEQANAEAARILEVLKTNDPDRAAVNLQFLIEAGLISDRGTRESVQEYLKNRRLGQGAFLLSSEPATIEQNKLRSIKSPSWGLETTNVGEAENEDRFTATLRTTDGRLIAFDPSCVDAISDGDEYSNKKVTKVFGILPVSIAIDESVQVFMQRLKIEAEFAKFTRPNRSSVWIKGASVMLVRPVVPGEYLEGTKAVIFARWLTQGVQESPTEARDALNAHGARLNLQCAKF
jgi:hypothetical protein